MPISAATLWCAAALALLAGPGGRASVAAQPVAAGASRAARLVPRPVPRPVASDDRRATTAPAWPDSLVDVAARRYMAAPGRVGLSVGVLRGGRVWSAHYGEVARGTGRRPTARTLYEIGSVTKTVTGHLLARAVVDGRLGLDDDARPRLGGSDANLAYAGQPIRLVHLVNHTSGLPVHSVEFPPGAPPDTVVAREARNTDAALLAPPKRRAHRQTTDTAAPSGVALGWEVGRGAGGRRRLSHGGGTLGYSAYLLVFPSARAAERVAVVCLANQAALEGELERLAVAVSDGLLAEGGPKPGGLPTAGASR